MYFFSSSLPKSLILFLRKKVFDQRSLLLFLRFLFLSGSVELSWQYFRHQKYQIPFLFSSLWLTGSSALPFILQIIIHSPNNHIYISSGLSLLSFLFFSFLFFFRWIFPFLLLFYSPKIPNNIFWGCNNVPSCFFFGFWFFLGPSNFVQVWDFFIIFFWGGLHISWILFVSSVHLLALDHIF